MVRINEWEFVKLLLQILKDDQRLVPQRIIPVSKNCGCVWS